MGHLYNPHQLLSCLAKSFSVRGCHCSLSPSLSAFPQCLVPAGTQASLVMPGIRQPSSFQHALLHSCIHWADSSSWDHFCHHVTHEVIHWHFLWSLMCSLIQTQVLPLSSISSNSLCSDKHSSKQLPFLEPSIIVLHLNNARPTLPVFICFCTWLRRPLLS